MLVQIFACAYTKNAIGMNWDALWQAVVSDAAWGDVSFEVIILSDVINL